MRLLAFVWGSALFALTERVNRFHELRDRAPEGFGQLFRHGQSNRAPSVLHGRDIGNGQAREAREPGLCWASVFTPDAEGDALMPDHLYVTAPIRALR
jgi:hypothetical protein